MSRPARQRWFDRSRLAFAVDVTDRPTARVDPHTHPRKKPPRVPFARDARTRHRLARRRRHRTIIHRIHPVGRRARARTHTHTQKKTIPSTLYIHRPTRTPSRLVYGHLAPIRTRRRRFARVAQSKRGVCVKSPVMIRRLRLKKIPRALFQKPSPPIVAPWSSLRSVERPRERGRTVGRVKK